MSYTYYPETLDPILGGGYAFPSLDAIAKAIAKRDNLRIAPTGDHALNWLGFSTQVPCNAVYWTDGTQRRINIGKGRGILFKHSTSMDNFAYQSDLMQLIVLAMRERGNGNLTETEAEVHVLGEHNVLNAVVAWAVGQALKLDEEEILDGIDAYRPSGMRQNMVEVGGYQLFVSFKIVQCKKKILINLKCILKRKNMGIKVKIL